jgi:hypothetical protein
MCDTIKKIFWGFIFVGILNLMFVPLGFSGKYPDVRPISPPLMQPDKDQTIIKNIGSGVFEIGGCKIIKKKHQVEFVAVVNMDKGILEYMIVNTNGKIHSSLLQTSIDSNALKISLLTIGLKGRRHSFSKPVEPRIPEGDRVKISIIWDENGEDRIIPVEHLIQKKGDSIDQIPWVFTGPKNATPDIQEQAQKSLVAIYHDPTALIDHELIEGNNSQIWSVHTKKVPPLGTLVRVVIEKDMSMGYKNN